MRWNLFPILVSALLNPHREILWTNFCEVAVFPTIGIFRNKIEENGRWREESCRVCYDRLQVGTNRLTTIGLWHADHSSRLIRPARFAFTVGKHEQWLFSWSAAAQAQPGFADWIDEIPSDFKRQLAVGNALNLICAVNGPQWRGCGGHGTLSITDTHRAKSEYTVARDQEIGTLSTSM